MPSHYEDEEEQKALKGSEVANAIEQGAGEFFSNSLRQLQKVRDSETIAGEVVKAGQWLVEGSMENVKASDDPWNLKDEYGSSNPFVNFAQVSTGSTLKGAGHVLRMANAPFWALGKGLGGISEHALGVDPRFGQWTGEIGGYLLLAPKLYASLARRCVSLKNLPGLFNVGTGINKNPVDPENLNRLRKIALNKKIKADSPIEDVLNPERLARIKNLKNELIKQVNQNAVDSLNPTLDLKTRMDLAGAQRYSGYEVGGTFRYKAFKEASKNMADQGRPWLGIYQAGFTGGGASRAVPFGQYRAVNLPRLKEAFRPTIQAMGLTEQSFQIHHMAALKSIMGIFDGLTMNSRIYREVSDTILKEIPGLGLGDMLGNLKPIVGRTSDIGTPHYLVHRFYNSKLGASGSGEAFFTDKVLKNMQISRPYRLRKAKEIGQIIRESEEIVTQAQKVYETLYTDVSLDQVVEVMSQMDEFGYVKLINRDYQVDKVPQIVEAIINDIEINGFPTRLGPSWWQEGRKIKKRLIKKPKKK